MLAIAPVAAKAAQDTSPQAGDSPKAKHKENHKPIGAAAVRHPVLWQDPGNIAGKDLLHGAGGEEGQPKPPFTFEAEVKHDSNPKFDVRDADGKKWRVKLGAEARPETVASRLLWAVGYFTDEDYVLPEARVEKLRTHRGSRFIRDGNELTDARFERKPGEQKRIASWEWKRNPFNGTREFNGLRVMMAVINSWDLKDENNAVYSDEKNGRQIFLVSDVGASFGTNGLRVKNENGKGNVDKFEESKFILRRDGKGVDFATPSSATRVEEESAGLLTPLYVRRQHYKWIGHDIPVTDAKWIGSLLGQLTHQQLVDAFRAGDFPPDAVETYVKVVEERIAELQQL